MKTVKMKTIKITIEKTNDGYSAYAVNVDGIYGMGDTAEECKHSILDAIETVKEFNEVNRPKFLDGEYQLVFKFDVESLLNYYRKYFGFSGLENVTDINQKQLQQYSTGLYKPRWNTKKKIERSLHDLGKELLAVEL